MCILKFAILGLDICVSYNIEDASEFVEQWIAYSVSHFNGGEPTLEYLNEFERKDLAGKREKQLNSKPNKSMHSTTLSASAVSGSSFQNDCDDEMLGAYICNTPKVSGIFIIREIASFIAQFYFIWKHYFSRQLLKKYI